MVDDSEICVQDDNMIKTLILEDNHEEITNMVVTSKYTAVTFLPQSFALQFRRFGNVYFSFIVVIMLVGTYTNCFNSPQKPWGNLSILVVVFALNMANEGFDDAKRHRKDEKVNKTPCLIYEDGQFRESCWAEVRRGTVVMIRKDEISPADVLICASAEMAKDPCCYIETASVDGETYLKRRIIHPTFFKLRETKDTIEEFAETLRGRELVYDPPLAGLNNFPVNFAGELLGSENVILRGCQLKSVKYALGIVLFTGKDTKVLMAQKAQTMKQSKVDKLSNQIIEAVLIVLFILIIVSLILFYTISIQDAWYLGVAESTIFPEWLAMALLYLVLYRQIMPILLYAVQEGMSIMHARYVSWDIRLYDEATGQPAVCQSTQLVQETGQVNWIFSDKTGTLTRNEMRLVSIYTPGGGRYGQRTIQDLEVLSLRETTDPYENTKLCFENLIYNEASERLLRAMALCHSVLVEHESGGSGQDPTRGLRRKHYSSIIADQLEHSDEAEIRPPSRNPNLERPIYNAESPDEEALVAGAAALGYQFLFTEGTSTIGISIRGHLERWQCLALCPFTSNRKRMSVLYEEPGTGRILLVCKGADNQMLAVAREKTPADELLDELNVWAHAGLRTLIVGERLIPREEYDEWIQRHAAATILPESERGAKMDEIACEIEKDLEIIGMTAVEDRLQENVNETLNLLLAAKIKFWLITGDKVETAISIGKSAGLIEDEMRLIELTTQNAPNIREFIEANTFEAHGDDVVDVQAGLGFSGRLRSFFARCGWWHKPKMRYKDNVLEPAALVVDGESLHEIFEDKGLEWEFLRLAVSCKVVIACRVSPKQKADLVLLIKHNVEPEPTTLAIGDGANDVPMIQAGNVGVGITGREGTHASAASDFKIAKFRFLAPLILIHGRLSYMRISKAITLTFYGNMLFTFIAFGYNNVSDQSGNPAFSVAQYAIFQAFIAVPAFALGWFDRDIKNIYGLLKIPSTYQIGRLNRLLYPAFVDVQILRGIIHSAIIFGSIIVDDVNVTTRQLESTMIMITTMVLVFFCIWDSSCITWFHLASYLFDVVVILLLVFVSSLHFAIGGIKSPVFASATMSKTFVIVLLVILIDYGLVMSYRIWDYARRMPELNRVWKCC